MGDFQLGLVLSGGATMGAYSAGVMDFLLEAISELELAKRAGQENLPPWNVKINNMSSTSAGSICTFLTAASVCLPHAPVPHYMTANDEAPVNNLLYRGWVTEDYKGLWGRTDLLPADENQPGDSEPELVRSIFDSNYLMKLGQSLVEDRILSEPVPRWFEGCRAQITCGNVRGVPYAFRVGTSIGEDDDMYRMLRHRDYVAFDTRADGPSAEETGAFALNLKENANSTEWRRFLQTCASSASVPVMFASQILTRPISQFHGKEHNMRPKVGPEWPEEIKAKKEYTHNTVDGGMFNNEPLALSRHALEFSGCKLETCATMAGGAVVLIDTDSNSDTLIDGKEEVRPLSLLRNLGSVFLSFWYDSSFKGDELKGMADSSNMSQFIISPLRENRQGSETLIATQALGGFAGALDRRLRHHDFMLGRRNAQQFLRSTFLIDKELAERNPVFQGIAEYTGEQRRVPIIPLLGSAAKDCPVPQWPAYKASEKDRIINSFVEDVQKRIDVVLAALARSFGMLRSSWLNPIQFGKNQGVRLVLRSVSGYIRSQVDSTVRADFDERIQGGRAQ